MYRGAASGIRWCRSKSGSFTPEPGCAIFHQHYPLRIYSKFAVDEDMGHHILTSGKRSASKMNAWGLNDNPSELHPSRIARERVGTPPMTGPSDSTMKTPRKSCGPSLSAPCIPQSIDLEARGFAILGQQCSLVNSKAAFKEEMGHRASTSGKRSASKMNAWGLNDNPSELHPSRIARERVGTPPMTGPSDSTMKTPRKSCGPSLSAPCIPQSIDLEARGFAILGQQCSLVNSKAAFKEEMGHRASTSGKSSGKMSQRVKRAFQRGFSSHEEQISSHEEQIPVVDNLIYRDIYDRKMDNLKSLRDCLSAGSILKTIKADGLFRQTDLDMFGNLSLADLGFHVLRQLTAIVTLNLMRGLNICELIKLDNLHWSSRHEGVVLSNTSLVVGSESKGCPYAAITRLFGECLGISMDVNPDHVRLPVLLRDYLELLICASHVDKRRINSHPIVLFPGERIQRKSRINHLLRHVRPRAIEKAAQDDLVRIRAHANNIFRAFATLFPKDLLKESGLHPLIDSWAREGQQQRASKKSKSPISVSTFKDGSLPLASQIELGELLVALHRDAFEHLYQPLFRGDWETSYTILQVDQLLDTLNPLYGPTANFWFMVTGCWHLLEVDPGCKPLYTYWTNLSEAPLPKN